mgnify:CR=1 FL=1
MIKNFIYFIICCILTTYTYGFIRSWTSLLRLNNNVETCTYELKNEYYQYLIDYNKIEVQTNNIFFGFNLGYNDNFIRDRYENYKIFEKNYKVIQDFNNANNSFKLGLNQFADTYEINGEDNDLMKKDIDNYKIFKNDLISIKQIVENPQYYLDKYRNLSSEIIWDNSILSPVKNQGRCGSCWAFSSTGAIEAKMRINNYSVDRLSEQELVDCSTKNSGCGGGLMHLAFDYCIEKNGLSSNYNYSYTAKNGVCLYNCNTTNNTELPKTLGSAVKDYRFTIPRSVVDLKASLKEGPICIALDASPIEFRFYRNGIIDLESKNTSRINHAVLLTGYSENINGSYWIIQNSWGLEWGDQGFAKIKIKNGEGVLLSQLYGVYPYI